MIGRWPSVIVTNLAALVAPDRATLWADHFLRAVQVFHGFRTI